MRFNFTKKRTATVTNYEGAKAYKLTPEVELYTAVVTSSLSNTYYETADGRLNRIIGLIAKCEPKFVAQLAIYTRNNMNLRTVPLVLLVELAKVHRGDSLLSDSIFQVIRRADEITELLAYYQLANKRDGQKKLNRISKQVQKGIARAFNKFDEYQFAKYNRKTEVALKDALFLVHPKATSEAQQRLYDKIVTDSLAVPYTWETELSALGQEKHFLPWSRAKAVRTKWEELIESRKVGYMATMRNLRNIIEANVSSKHIEMVCDFLSNPSAVQRSRQLPFRFLAAYREVIKIKSRYTSAILDALEDAVLHSAQNIKGFGYDTSVAIACDVSGSMQRPISPRSKILAYDIGLMLGMLMRSRCKTAVTGMFGDRWKTVNLPGRSVLSNVQEFHRREGEVGYSTNGYLVLRDLIRRKSVVDKVMIFTDLQMWTTTGVGDSMKKEWLSYKRMVAPEAKLYLFDLAGYGNTPIDIKSDDVFLIAGWSDKVFDILAAIEEGSSAVAEIKKVEICPQKH